MFQFDGLGALFGGLSSPRGDGTGTDYIAVRTQLLR